MSSTQLRSCIICKKDAQYRVDVLPKPVKATVVDSYGEVDSQMCICVKCLRVLGESREKRGKCFGVDGNYCATNNFHCPWQHKNKKNIRDMCKPLRAIPQDVTRKMLDSIGIPCYAPNKCICKTCQTRIWKQVTNYRGVSNTNVKRESVMGGIMRGVKNHMLVYLLIMI